MNMHVVPSRFKDEDILYLYEAMNEVVSAFGDFVNNGGGEDAIELLAGICADARMTLDEIDSRVLIPCVYME